LEFLRHLKAAGASELLDLSRGDPHRRTLQADRAVTAFAFAQADLDLPRAGEPVPDRTFRITRGFA
jgi:hypothetical protein